MPQILPDNKIRKDIKILNSKQKEEFVRFLNELKIVWHANLHNLDQTAYLFQTVEAVLIW